MKAPNLHPDTLKALERRQAWFDFLFPFGYYKGEKRLIKITCLKSDKITWDSLTGHVEYSTINEKLRFQSNEKGYKYEFEIVDIDSKAQTFKTLSQDLFKIELIEN